MLGLRSGLAAGARAGLAVGVSADPLRPDASSAADRDATSNIYVPSTAGQFTALGITAPSHLWLCQEAAGNLADSIGGMTLTASGSPTYQQAVSGWSRKGVGFTVTLNQRFSAAAGVGPDPGSVSTLWLAYVAVIGAQGGNRDIFGPNNTAGGTAAKVQTTTTPRVRGSFAGTVASGTSDPTATGLQPMVIKVDRTNSTAVVYTGQEKITGTYSAIISESTAKGFGSSGSTSFGGLIAYSALWSGAAAEVSDAQAKTLLQALGWSIPWS